MFYSKPTIYLYRTVNLFTEKKNRLYKINR